MICIGIDESYKDTGITVNKNGKVIKAYSVKPIFRSKTEYRCQIAVELNNLLSKLIKKYGSKDIVIVVERIRQFSGRFISMDYIKSIAALISCIVDIAYSYQISVYSVDTRCWKANIVGTSKPKKNLKKIEPKKYPTYEWCIKNKYNKYIMEKDKYNDNIGDSIGISFTYFNENCKNKLKLET